jgi:hypothetical protein
MKIISKYRYGMVFKLYFQFKKQTAATHGGATYNPSTQEVEAA